MLLNIFGKSAEISLIENKVILEKLKSYLEYYEGSNISSNELANKLNISYSDAKKVMNELLKNKIVDMLFKVYCSNEIDLEEPEIYDNIEDIPSNECDKCDKKCSVLKNIIIIYKVLGEDK